LAALHDELARDVRERGFVATLRDRALDFVHAADDAPQHLLGEDLRDLVAQDPQLAPHVAALPAAPPPAHRSLLDRVRDLVEHRLRPHPEILEGDGTPMQCVESAEFENWGRTVANTPALTLLPRTKVGVCNLVKWARANGRTVRVAGYRHSWSSVFSADGQVLVSLLPLHVVEDLPAPEPGIDPADELQRITVVGTVDEDGVTKALCRIGAATTNEQFRRWCTDPRGGNRKWTVPLNVIMVEITWGGSNAPICHGAGLRHLTLSDLVTEIEFVNARGELQTVTDQALLRVAAGCFGLLGVVTAITLKLDPMSYAALRPAKLPVPLTIPPPHGLRLPSAVDMRGITAAQLETAWERFVGECENAYYSEWFWFPYAHECWVNCWSNDGRREDAQPYPSRWETLIEEAEEYLMQLLSTTVFRALPGRVQAELLAAGAMASLPTKPAVAPLIDALHFRRGIQNFRVLDMELEIPIPPREDDPSRPDWSVCQKAWWAVLVNVLQRSGLEDAPMRVALEMRVMGGSSITMAPQYGNALGTCSIEVLTTHNTPAAERDAFFQEVVDAWASLTGPGGAPLNVRPHWAKIWENLRFRGLPAVEYARTVAYPERIPEFLAGLDAVAQQGGYGRGDLRLFTNPLLDQLFPELSAAAG
jgi:hypothetical protein